MAGVTALCTLRSRPILGRRVLTTGTAGGAGRYAVRLAAPGGAQVTASVGGGPSRRPDRMVAHDRVVGLEAFDRPVDVILDNVGGPQPASAWELLAPYSLFFTGPRR